MNDPYRDQMHNLGVNTQLSTKTICRRKPQKPNPHGVSVGAMSKASVNIIQLWKIQVF